MSKENQLALGQLLQPANITLEKFVEIFVFHTFSKEETVQLYITNHWFQINFPSISDTEVHAIWGITDMETNNKL